MAHVPARAPVAGFRWAIEDGFQQAKTEVGLDHYEVRHLPMAPEWTVPVQPGLVLARSRWRRRHQARARREPQLRLEHSEVLGRPRPATAGASCCPGS